MKKKHKIRSYCVLLNRQFTIVYLISHHWSNCGLFNTSTTSPLNRNGRILLLLLLMTLLPPSMAQAPPWSSLQSPSSSRPTASLPSSSWRMVRNMLTSTRCPTVGTAPHSRNGRRWWCWHRRERASSMKADETRWWWLPWWWWGSVMIHDDDLSLFTLITYVSYYT